jgi:hypothetical protein
VVVAVLGEEVDGDALSNAASATPALAGVRAGDETVVEGGHAAERIVTVLLHTPSIDYEGDIVDGDGGLSNIGGEDNLADPRGGASEDPPLVLWGDGGVDGEDPVALLLRAEGVDELLLQRRDLLNPGKENKDGVGGAVKGLGARGCEVRKLCPLDI